MQEHGIPAAVVVKFLSSRRIEIEKTGLYSFLVLFSMGITKGKWSTLVTELINFKDLYDANAPLNRVLPALAEAHPEAYGKMGLKDLCEQMHRVYREDNLPKAQKDMYTTLPEMAMRPADAYERLVRGRVESVEIDNLMGRTLAVMVVPVPARHSGDHAGRAHHAGDQVDPGLSALRARVRPASSRASRPTSTACASSPPPAAGAIWSTASREEPSDDPALRESAHDPDPLPQAAQGRRDRRRAPTLRPSSCSTISPRRTSRSR